MKSARWLVPILLLAFALRLANITTMSLRADEASNLFFASQDLNAIVKQLVTDDPHPPLYFFILHFWVAIVGNSELAIRFLGVFAGTLIVSLVQMLARLVFRLSPPSFLRGREGVGVALVAAALAAINPSLIWDAQDAHLYPWLVLTSLASFVAFLQLSFRRSNATEKSLAKPRFFAALEMTTARPWLTYVLMSASALYFHYIAAFILAAQGTLAFFAWARGVVSKRAFLLWLTAQFAIAMLFLPWFFLAGGLLRGYQTDFFPPADFFEMLVRSLEAFSVGRVDDRLLTPMIEPGFGSFAAALLVIGK